jgi:hypothetical protein
MFDAATAGNRKSERGEATRAPEIEVDERLALLCMSAAQAFEPIRRIGGKNGWYFPQVLWTLLGTVDRLLGGPGLRGRSFADDPQPGDAIDFWRVEQYERNHKLRLVSELKVPGRCWLDFEIESEGKFTILRQRAEFEPHGIAGRIYWAALLPLHRWIFAGLLREIVLNAMSRKTAKYIPNIAKGLPASKHS